MDDKERFLHLKSVNDRIYEQLSYAESKNAILTGLVGAAIFALVNLAIKIDCSEYLWAVIICGLMILSLITSLCIAVSSFIPNLNKNNPAREKNLFFYGDISKFESSKDYLNCVKICDDLEEQIAEQNIAVSKIIGNKHKKFVLALKFSFAGVLLPYYLFWLFITVKNKYGKYLSYRKL